MTLRRLQASIERRHLEPLVIDLKKLPGVYCLAMYSMNSHYYRAKVETVKSQTREAKVLVEEDERVWRERGREGRGGRERACNFYRVYRWCS